MPQINEGSAVWSFLVVEEVPHHHWGLLSAHLYEDASSYALTPNEGPEELWLLASGLTMCIVVAT